MRSLNQLNIIRLIPNPRHQPLTGKDLPGVPGRSCWAIPLGGWGVPDIPTAQQGLIRENICSRFSISQGQAQRNIYAFLNNNRPRWGGKMAASGCGNWVYGWISSSHTGLQDMRQHRKHGTGGAFQGLTCFRDINWVLIYPPSSVANHPAVSEHQTAGQRSYSLLTAANAWCPRLPKSYRWKVPRNHSLGRNGWR